MSIADGRLAMADRESQLEDWGCGLRLSIGTESGVTAPSVGSGVSSTAGFCRVELLPACQLAGEGVGPIGIDSSGLKGKRSGVGTGERAVKTRGAATAGLGSVAAGLGNNSSTGGLSK